MRPYQLKLIAVDADRTTGPGSILEFTLNLYYQSLVPSFTWNCLNLDTSQLTLKGENTLEYTVGTPMRTFNYWLDQGTVDTWCITLVEIYIADRPSMVTFFNESIQAFIYTDSPSDVGSYTFEI